MSANTTGIPASVLEDIARIAHRHHVNRVILYGSRARGAYRSDSDIDLAIDGGDFGAFFDDLRANVNSLLTFDVVDYNRENSQDFWTELKRDGIVMITKYDNFIKAVDSLGRSIGEYAHSTDETIIAGIVMQFSLCFDQCWKAIRTLLDDNGINIEGVIFPREVIALAAESHLIRPEQHELWLQLLAARNKLVHRYSQAMALDEVDKIKTVYYPLLRQLRDTVVAQTQTL